MLALNHITKLKLIFLTMINNKHGMFLIVKT